MEIKDCMTSGVQYINKDKTFLEATQLMKSKNIGALPIEEDEKLIGMITDRDILMDVVAEGKDLNCKISDLVGQDDQKKIKYCFEDETPEEVAKQMDQLQVRRLPVMDRNKRLVGIISLSDIQAQTARLAS